MPVPTQTSSTAVSTGSATAAMMRPVPLEETEDVARIVATPNRPFFLRHHPEQWEVVSEGLKKPTLVPIIGRHALQPGVLGIRTLNRGEDKREAHKNAKRDAEDRGWVYLDQNAPIGAEHLPDGIPEGGYLRRLACRDLRTTATGFFYLEAWEVPEEVPRGRPQTFAFDRAAYNRWRAHLVESGVVKPPMPGVRRELERRYAARVGRAEVLNVPDEVRKRRVKDAQALADAHTGAVVPGEKGTK